VMLGNRVEPVREGGLDRDNVKELGVPRMQSAETAGKTYRE
jgi:hypothetical protein